MAADDALDSALIQFKQEQDDQKTLATTASVHQAITQNPDEMARYNTIARKVGIDPLSIATDPEVKAEAERRARMIDLNIPGLVQTHPKTASALTDADFAALAHDDVGALQTLEDTFGFFKRSGEALLSAVPQAAGGLWGVTRAASDVFIRPYTRLAAEVTGAPLDLGAAISERAKVAQQRLSVSEKALMPQGESTLESGYYSGLQSLGISALTLPFAALGAPEAALGAMSAVTGGQAYGEAADKGVSPAMAFMFGMSQAGVEYWTEKIPLEKLIKDLKVGSPFYKTLAHQMAREVPGEQIATLVQDLNEWAVLHPDKPFSSYLEDRPSAAAQTLIATVIGTGGVVATAKGLEYLVRQDENQQKVQHAEDSYQILSKLSQTATAAKLRERDPVRFKEFMQSMADGSDLKEVFIDGTKLQNALAQAPVEVQQQFAKDMPGVISQLGEAVNTEGTVRVPVEDYATHIAGTELDAAILPNLKTDIAGLTYNEVQEQVKTQTAEMTADAEKILAEKEQDKEFQADAARVYDTLLQRVESAQRFSPDANKKYAALQQAFFITQAKKLGMKPSELLSRFDIKVQAERTGGAELEQSLRENLRDMLHNPTQEMIDLDIKINKLLGGEDETISARVGKAKETSAIAALIAKGLDNLDPGHTDRAVLAIKKAAGERLAELEGVQPLEGLPQPKMMLKTGEYTPKPYAPAYEAAQKYAAQAGIDYTPPRRYVRVDEARARRIAAEYEKMPHAPNDPEVAAAYAQLIKEAVQQYHAMLSTGLKVEFIPEGAPDPYADNPHGFIDDIRRNNHLWVFSTRAGFGTAQDFTPKDHPLLAETNIEISGQKALANDIFRAVHDFFGHAKDGVGFRANGEENAWRSHAAMFSPLARRALTTETRGQNSWLNFGPYGEANRTAKAEDTHFADQKAGLLPEWVSEEGREDTPARTTPASSDYGYRAREKARVATLDDFKPAVVEGLLRKKNWAILTAENPNTQQLSAEENAQRNAELKADLDALGVQYVELEGKYGGNVENSFAIAGITKDQAVELGQKYGQQAVLTRDGFVAQDGTVQPAKGVKLHAETPSDFYSRIPATGAIFAVDIDFEKKLPASDDRAGSVTVQAVHFSREPRSTLSGRMYGTGIKGAEARRLADPNAHPKIKQRISFYVDEGQGVRPEAGVGAFRHELTLTNIYDGAKNPLGFPSEPNAFEAAVIEAGFDGYYIKEGFGNQGVGVLLGDAAQNVEVDIPPVSAVFEQRYQTETPEFKNWFGDSKVVDEEGKPLVVYHGTKADITEFKSSRTGVGSTIFGDYEVTRHGIFVTPSSDLAGEFATQGVKAVGAHIMPLYASIKNPLDMTLGYNDALFNRIEAWGNKRGENGYRIARNIGDAWGDWMLFDEDAGQDPEFFIGMLKDLGYDGVKFHEPKVAGEGAEGITYVAFEPTQIKSATGNIGTFDPKNANILYQSLNEIAETLPPTGKLEQQDLADLRKLWTMYAQADTAAQYGTAQVKAYRDDAPGLQRALTDTIDAVMRNGAEASVKNITKWHEGTARLPAGGFAYEIVSGNSSAAVYLDMADRSIQIDIMRWGEGRGGSGIYKAVLDFARANGFVFYGDAQGISVAGIKRRLENLLSHALQSGDTSYMRLHPKQIEFIEQETGLKIDWTNDSKNNVEQMLNASYNLANLDIPELKNVYFDFVQKQFVARDTGAPADLAGLITAARRNVDAVRREGAPGLATAKRTVFANTLLSASGENRRRVFAEMARFSLEQLPGAERLLYQSKAGGKFVSYPGGEGASGIPAAQVAQKARRLKLEETPAHPGIRYVTATLEKVGERELPATVTSTAELAAATKYLSRAAVEHFDAIVTDKKGKVLAVVGSFKGAPTQTSVYPATLAMEIAKVKGAANAWASHNHPSGTAELSSADERLSAAIGELLRGSGITYRGLIAVTGKQYASTDGEQHALIPERDDKKVLAPIAERMIQGDPLDELAIDGPSKAKQVVSAIAKDQPGILFLSAQYAPVSFVPFSPAKMGELRYQDNLKELLNAAASTGAAATIIANPGNVASVREYNNVSAALRALDLGVLDVINYDFSEEGATNFVAATERGTLGPPDVFAQRIVPIDEEQIKRLQKIFDGDRFEAESFYRRGYRVDEFGDMTRTGEDLSASDMFQKNRGTFNPDTLTISLLKDADLTTFLHENGHAFLEIEAELASEPGAPAEIRADFQRVMDWFGIADVATWNAMGFEQKRTYHEKFARGFEAYLLEGKAPSNQLRSIFASFKSWLLHVYKMATNLNVELTDEVRGVFDRMLASEEEIAAVQERAGMTAAMIEAADEEAKKAYVALDTGAGDDATDELQRRSLRDMKWLSNAKSEAMKKLQREAASKRKEVRAEVTAEVEAEPVNQARAFLRKGITKDPVTGDSIQATEGFRLNRDIVAQMYPETMLARPDLSKLRGMTEKDGLHPDLVADMFGFRSGDVLIRELIDGENPRDKIAGLTDQRMLERYGDLVDERAIEEAANEAVHNDARARFMATGLKMLSNSKLPVSQIQKAAADAADATIAAKKVRDLHPAKYIAAETKANKEVLKTVAKDAKAAQRAQRAALLNNRLAKAAQDAQEEVRKGVDKMTRTQKAAAQANMRGEYLIQLNELLARFDLRKSTTLKEIDAKRTPLSTWLASESERLSATAITFVQNPDGSVTPDIPAWILNESNRRSYKDLTVEEFRGLLDTVKQMELLARREQEQYQAIRGMKFKEERQAILDRIRQFHPEAFSMDGEPLAMSPKFVKHLGDKVEEIGEKFVGEFLNAETLVNLLEGGEFGLVHESLLGRMSKQADWKATRLGDIYAKMAPLFGQYSVKERYDFARADIGAPIGMSLTRENALVVALLHGNTEGRERLANYGWDEKKQQSIIDLLDERDMRLAEGIWDLFDNDLWPDLKALNERTRGKAPPKVVAIQVFHGGKTYRGGYFRLKYDTNLDERAYRLDEGAAVKELLGGGLGMSAKTGQGSSTERKQNVTMRPRLDLGVFAEAVSETVHDLAYREAVADTMRLLNDVRVQNTIKTAAGVPTYRALITRVREIAAPPRNPAGFIEKTLSTARKNTIITLMSGVNTALQNFTGFVSAVARVNPGRLTREIALFYSPQMSERYNFAIEHSTYMRNRHNAFERDLQNEIKKMTVNANLMPDTGAWLTLMSMVDKGTSVPVWNAAFAEGMAKFENDTSKAVDYADHVVRQTQGSGRELDVAQIMSGHGGYGQLKRIFTMFYSYFNAQLGMLVRSGMISARAAKANPAMAVAHFTKDFMLIVILPAVLTKMVFKGGGDDEDPEDWLHTYGHAIAMYGLAMIPLVRDIGSFAWASFDHDVKNYGYKITPVQAAGEGIVKGMVATRDIAVGEGDDRDLKNLIMGTSYSVGLPGKLISDTTLGTKAFLEGEAGPEAVVFGPPKK